MSDDTGHPCARFLSDLFDGVEGLVELRPLPDAEGADFATASKGRRWLTPEEAIARGPAVSEWCQAHGLGAFYGVLPRREPGNGKRANVHGGRVAWADLDFKDYADGDPEARQRLSLLRLWPSILVSSGHGLHAYWLLHDVAESAEIEAANTLLIEAIGADPACKDAARVMRLPGSWNVKDPDHPREVEIIDHSGDRYSLSEVMAAAAARIEEMKPTESPPVAPRPSGGADTRPAGETRTERYLAATLAGVLDDIAAAGKGTRNQQLNRGAYSLGRLVGAGVLTEAAAVAELTGAATGIGLGAHEAERTIRSGIEAGILKPWEPDLSYSPSASGGPPGAGGSGAVAPKGRPPKPPPETCEIEVWERLRVSRDKKPFQSLGNVVHVLDGDSRWAGRLYLDEMDDLIYADGSALTDDYVRECACWLEDCYRLQASTALVHEAVSLVAKRHARHPLRELLTTLGDDWDGTARLSSWMSDYLGAPDDDLHSAIGRAWLISGAARILTEDAVKVDTMPILMGAQGAGKSTCLRVLALSDRWFSDSHLDFNYGLKDSYQALRGVFMFEIAELDGITRAKEMSTVKAFISSSEDHYRPSYGRCMVTRKRQTILCGSTNEKTWLRDSTGSRRFWPIAVGEVDLEGLREAVRGLWGEAVRAFQAGEQWHLSPEIEEQRARMAADYQVADTWTEAILRYGNGQQTPFTVAEVLSQALDMDLSRAGRLEERRVVAVLQIAGFESCRLRDGTRKIRAWRRPTVVEFPGAESGPQVDRRP